MTKPDCCDKNNIKNATSNSEVVAVFTAAKCLKDIKVIAETLPELILTNAVDYKQLFNSQDFENMGRRDSVRWGYLLGSSIGQVDVDANWVWSIYDKISSGGESNSSLHFILEGIDNWMMAWPNRTSTLLSHAQMPASPDNPIVRMSLFALVKIDMNEALQNALKLIDDPRPNVSEGAIATLGRLTELTSEDVAAIALAKLFDDSGTTDGTRKSGYALKAMLNFRTPPKSSTKNVTQKTTPPREHPLFDARIQKAIEDCDEIKQAELYSSLFRSPNAFTADQREALFMNIHAIPANQVQTIQDAGMALYGLDPILNFENVLRYLKAFLSTKHRRSFGELYHLDGKFADSGEEIPLAYAAEMLVAGDIGASKAVPDLFEPLDLKTHILELEGRPWKTETDANSRRWEPAELAYLVRRSIGYLFMQHGAAVSLMAAALAELVVLSKPRTNAGKHAKAHLDEALDAIEHIWLRSYPTDVSLFEEIAKQRPIIKNVVLQLKRNTETYVGSISALAMNKAMRPSSSQRQIQLERHRLESKKIQQSAHEQSIFASIMQESVILYGEGILRQVAAPSGQPPERVVTPMSVIETSASLPRRSILHPVHFSFQLLQLRLERPPITDKRALDCEDG
tara:strand:+ start:1945 stop:3822 length:1878 start_codon:yes stop_codon:yes gene_type:complete